MVLETLPSPPGDMAEPILDLKKPVSARSTKTLAFSMKFMPPVWITIFHLPTLLLEGSLGPGSCGSVSGTAEPSIAVLPPPLPYCASPAGEG